MSKGKWRRPTPKQIQGYVEALKTTGIAVSQIDFREDGSFTISTAQPPPESANDSEVTL